MSRMFWHLPPRKSRRLPQYSTSILCRLVVSYTPPPPAVIFARWTHVQRLPSRTRKASLRINNVFFMCVVFLKAPSKWSHSDYNTQKEIHVSPKSRTRKISLQISSALIFADALQMATLCLPATPRRKFKLSQAHDPEASVQISNIITGSKIASSVQNELSKRTDMFKGVFAEWLSNPGELMQRSFLDVCACHGQVGAMHQRKHLHCALLACTADGSWMSSHLQTWQCCPVSYFSKYGLLAIYVLEPNVPFAYKIQRVHFSGQWMNHTIHACNATFEWNCWKFQDLQVSCLCCMVGSQFKLAWFLDNWARMVHTQRENNRNLEWRTRSCIISRQLRSHLKK